MRVRKRGRTVLVVVGVLLVVEVTTYCLLAERAMPVAAVRSLREYKMLRGRRFALVPRETWDAMSAGQQAALAAELRRHVQVIYHSHDEISVSSLHTQPLADTERQHYERALASGRLTGERLEAWRQMVEAGRKADGYTDGMSIGWQLEWRAPFVMKSKASMWVASAGAEGRWDIYVWAFGWWVRVWNTGSVMA